MPVEHYIQDIWTADEEIIIHGCNCFNTMGAGFAKQVKQRCPEAYQADLATGRGDRNKLGRFTYGVCKNNGILIINAYTQYNLGSNFDLEAFTIAMINIFMTFEKNKVFAMPKIGSGIGGGDWDEIEKILDIYSDYHEKIVNVYSLPYDK